MTDKVDLIVLTHNDLDAMGCILNIEYKMPDATKKYFYTNYQNLPLVVEEIIDYIKDSGYDSKHILIPDVSFGTHKEQFKQLYETGKKIILIDHHLYEDGFFDEFPDAKIVWDKAYCAATLCNQYFKNKGENDRLDRLTEIIDAYDLWKEQSPLFKVSQDFNNYFWQAGDPEYVAKLIINNGYKLPNDFKEITANIRNENANKIKEFNEKGYIQRFGKISLALVDSHFNAVIIDEMDKGQEVVISVTSYGIIRFRINYKADFKYKDKIEIRKLLTGDANTGHENAFTWRLNVPKNCSFDQLMAETQAVLRESHKILYSQEN